MKEYKRRTLMLIIITISVLVLMVMGATYAYFSTTKDLEDGVVGTNVTTAATTYSFTAKTNETLSGGKIELDISSSDMSEANVSSTKIKSDTAGIDVSLVSPNESTITACSYDIVWVWDSTDKYTEAGLALPYVTDEALETYGYTREEWYGNLLQHVIQYLNPSDEQLQEFEKLVEVNGYTNEQIFEFLITPILAGNSINDDIEDFSLQQYGVKDNAVYLYEFSAKVQGYKEHDLTKLAAGQTANSLIIQKGVGITATGTTVSRQTHVVEASIYNLPVSQTKIFGKNYSAHLTVENLSCTMKNKNEATTLATYITDTVYNSAANQNSITAATPGSGLYKHTTTLTNSAGDDSYRYAGVDTEVNNYVCFAGSDCTIEDNLYRIISVDSNNRTKIIKAKTAGMMRWNNMPKDYNGETINNWEGSILETYLNGEYLQGLGTKANLVENTIWSVGGASFDDISSKNVHDFMGVELAKSTTYTGKVGLMYAYEYGFAALPSNWENELLNYEPSLGNDWMFSMVYPWTISHGSDNLYSAFGVGFDDSTCVLSSYVYFFGNVYPVFSLVSTTKLLNSTGENVGTKTNPMIII